MVVPNVEVPDVSDVPRGDGPCAARRRPVRGEVFSLWSVLPRAGSVTVRTGHSRSDDRAPGPDRTHGLARMRTWVPRSSVQTCRESHSWRAIHTPRPRGLDECGA